MLEGFFGKVMAGLLSVSTLMFSPYTGNEPVFQTLQCRAGQNYLITNTNLNRAFDNDFTDVFNCGKPVNLWFKIEVRQNNNIVHTSSYRHTITYSPMHASWEVFFSENGKKEIYETYLQMLDNISELECSIPRGTGWRVVEIRVESWLQTIELTEPDRTIDLMVLWKFKRPSIKRNFTLPPVS